MKLKNWHLLEMMGEYYNVDIDSENPRDSRLAVALECDRHEKVPEAIEAMTGIPLHEYDPMELMVLSMNRMSRDPQTFYEGFPSVDN